MARRSGKITKAKLLSRVTRDDYLRGYFECALWASTDDRGEPLDKRYTLDDLTVESILQMIGMAREFIGPNGRVGLEGDHDLEGIGHDLWLSQNGHGSGFFAGDYGDAADFLQHAAEEIGPADLHNFGGRLYLMRG